MVTCMMEEMDILEVEPMELQEVLMEGMGKCQAMEKGGLDLGLMLKFMK